MLSIGRKRNAASMEDSITAQNIDQLPDVSIADSLQRIPGVQINREAGVGSSVNVRGLPEVGQTLNGEAFITANTIVGQQPTFISLPSQLFKGADVIKSPTASTLNSGISGTINLRTRRPWDLKSGWTVGGSARIEHGAVTDKWQPEVDALASYNADGRWGILFSAAYSDVTRESSNDGMVQNDGVINGENAASATADDGFLGAFNGITIPPEIHQLGGGNVDVNGNGNANDAFFGSQDFNIFDGQEENKRVSASASAQFDFGSGLTLTSDLFFTRLNNYNRINGYQLQSANWEGATFAPLVSRDTGRTVTGEYNGGSWDPGQEFHTTQVYKKWLGDFETWAENDVTRSISRNFNIQLNYDNGGAFTGDVRAIASSAQQSSMDGYVQFTDANGRAWANDPPDAAPPGVYIYPSQLGGNRVFNPNGFTQNTVPTTVDMRGTHLAITMPQKLREFLDGRNNYVLKTVTSEGDHDTQSGMTILRADGHYDVFDGDDNGIKLDFGLRSSIRSASRQGFQLNAPVYAGMGASDPNGCMAHYLAADVVLNGAGIDGACTAGNSQGYFLAGVLAGLNASELPDVVKNNFRKYSNLADVKGVSIYNVDPKAMDNVYDFMNTLYPGQQRQYNPGTTWDVLLKQRTAYLQADFDGDIGLHYDANVGVRVVRTSLHVTQHLTGNPRPYGLLSADAGTTATDRSYTDVLPAANLALDLTPKLKLRLSYSKNMMPLDLNAWGGGLTLGYALDAKTGVFRVTGGSSDGNPQLDPWRSTNYGASLEYYMTPSSVLSLAAFQINVDSFIKSGDVKNCSLPDQDGVVRGRCVAIYEPIQGKGKTLHGLEFDYKQAFDFLPGLLSNTGAEFNYTWSPNDSGSKDLAGHTIPFQDNSENQANLILWYQDDLFQARIAWNYRSKRAVSESVGGISGLEEYQAPTLYLDASLNFNVTPNVQVFVQGSNLTGEHERYYLVWPDQVANTTQFEKRYTAGVRVHF
jgi:TonB-dependent receptor